MQCYLSVATIHMHLFFYLYNRNITICPCFFILALCFEFVLVLVEVLVRIKSALHLCACHFFYLFFSSAVLHYLLKLYCLFNWDFADMFSCCRHYIEFEVKLKGCYLVCTCFKATYICVFVPLVPAAADTKFEVTVGQEAGLVVSCFLEVTQYFSDCWPSPLPAGSQPVDCGLLKGHPPQQQHELTTLISLPSSESHICIQSWVF